MKILSLLILTLFISLPGTSRAQIYGCTDPQATNYNSAANRNDGSCLYNPASVSSSASFNLAGNLSETSGLICWTNQVWTHNDSDDINLYALDSTNGNIARSIALAGTTNTDWEEISQDADFVYVGDFGNNHNGNRTDLHILRISKNSILSDQPVIETINFSYSNQTDFAPTGSNNTDFDCEAFIVSDDSIFLFTKQWISSKTSLYSMPKTTGTHIAHLKSTLDVQGLITGATFLESKNLVALCGYSKDLQPFMYFLYDYPGHDFFGGNKRKINISLPFHQVEGIATTNGLKYYISNEYFSQPPIINNPQKLHILDLSNYLGDYLNSLYTFHETRAIDNEILFPNPASDYISLKSGRYHLPTTYRIINQSGSTVIAGKLTEQNQGINLSGLSPDVYIIKIGNDNLHSFKVVKK